MYNYTEMFYCKTQNVRKVHKIPVDKNKADWYSKLVEQLRQTKSCTTNIPFDVEGRLHYNKKKTLGGLKYGSSTCRTNLRCAYANDHGR